IDMSTSLRSSPGISALTSIALSVSEISMFGMIFCPPSEPTPWANSVNSRSISRCRPNNPKPGGINVLDSRDGTSDLNLMGFSFLLEGFVCGWCQVRRRLRLGTDHDPVFDLGDAGRRPGDALRFLALDPGANGTFQYHLASVRFDGNPIGVRLGISLECLHDLALEVRGLHLGLHRDDVGHALYAFHLSHCGLSGGFLILPLHRAFQG